MAAVKSKEKPPVCVVKTPDSFDGEVNFQCFGKEGLVITLQVGFKYFGKTAAQAWWDEVKVSDRPAYQALTDIVSTIESTSGALVPFTEEISLQLIDHYKEAFADTVTAFFYYLNESRLKN